MNILHTVAALRPDSGGPAASVPALCAALAAMGHDVTLLVGAGELAPTVRELDARGVRVVTASVGHYLVANFSREYQALALAHAVIADVVHTHGLWLHPNFASFEAATRTSKPLVVSPRGMLASWALGRSRWRKKLMWSLFQHRCLASASFVHATSGEELDEIRAAGVTAPVAVIPNGLDLAQYCWEKILALRSGGREQTILFLSRIHPKKGLDLLLDAWRRVARVHREAKLVIAGPGEDRYVDDLRAWLADATLARVEYVGSVEGDAKLELLSRAVALVLPSHNENYGMVVAEALACGTPVITTTGVPWPELESRGCGWRVSVESGALADAMTDALGKPDAAIDAMGAIGRAVIDDAHSVGSAATRMEAAYAWCRGDGVKPEFVSTGTAAA